MNIDSPNSSGISTGFGIPTGGTVNQILIKNSSTNYDTSWSTSSINDVGSSGYIDIGSVRWQWGTVALNGSNTVTLPAAFANTNYSLTITMVGDISGNLFSATVASKTTTSFISSKRGVSTIVFNAGEGYSWMAIGLKP
jgi:hypothetical protein